MERKRTEDNQDDNPSLKKMMKVVDQTQRQLYAERMLIPKWINTSPIRLSVYNNIPEEIHPLKRVGLVVKRRDHSSFLKTAYKTMLKKLFTELPE